MRKTGVFKNNSGGVLVFLVIVLVVLIGVSALAIDLGQIYVAKQRAQNICDLSALAGAYYIDPSVASTVTANPANPGPAEQIARECALANNKDENNGDQQWKIYEKDSPDIEGVTISFPTNKSMKVEGQVPVKYAFAGIFGLKEKMVHASATVEVVMIKSLTTNIIPMAINESMVTSKSFGDPITLKGGSWDNGFIGSGNWSPVQFTSADGSDESGASIYRSRLEGDPNLPPVTVSIGDTLSTQTGKLVGPTDQGIEPRLDNTTWDTWTASYDPFTSFEPTTRIAIVPIIEDPMLGLSGQSDRVTVVGFAAIYIEELLPSSGNDYPQVTCRLIGGAVGEDAVRWTEWLGVTGTSSTLYKPRLVE